jgi:hypothetical protein
MVGLPGTTLHDSRYTPLTPKEPAGCADFDRQQVAAHYHAAFTQKTYVRARPDDLHPGTAAPARIHKIA